MHDPAQKQHFPSRLLTVAEAAQFLGCSETNVYALIDGGDLPFVCIGRRKGYRLDRSDLEAFIERRKQSKATAPARKALKVDFMDGTSGPPTIPTTPLFDTFAARTPAR